MKYKRVLLKLSGESLMGNKSYGICPDMLQYYAQEVQSIIELNVEVAIVIGGGNIYRGLNHIDTDVDRVQGDHMGMLATVINGLALQSTFEKNGIFTRLISAIEMQKIAEPFIRRKAIRHLEKKRTIIFVAGIGNPFFTTDTAGMLRAMEIEADAILKGTKVDGIYSSDPIQNKDALRYDSISFDEVYKKKLAVMDMTAFTLGQENKMPIIVFDINIKNNLKRLILGEQIGTLVNIKGTF